MNPRKIIADNRNGYPCLYWIERSNPKRIRKRSARFVTCITHLAESLNGWLFYVFEARVGYI